MENSFYFTEIVFFVFKLKFTIFCNFHYSRLIFFYLNWVQNSSIKSFCITQKPLKMKCQDWPGDGLLKRRNFEKLLENFELEKKLVNSSRSLYVS